MNSTYNSHDNASRSNTQQDESIKAFRKLVREEAINYTLTNPTEDPTIPFNFLVRECLGSEPMGQDLLNTLHRTLKFRNRADAAAQKLLKALDIPAAYPYNTFTEKILYRHFQRGARQHELLILLRKSGLLLEMRGASHIYRKPELFIIVNALAAELTDEELERKLSIAQSRETETKGQS